MAGITGITPGSALGARLSALTSGLASARLEAAIRDALVHGRISRVGVRLDGSMTGTSSIRQVLVQPVLAGAPPGRDATRQCLLSVMEAPGGVGHAISAPMSADPSPTSSPTPASTATPGFRGIGRPLPGSLAEAARVVRFEGSEQDIRLQNEWLSTLIDALPDLICFKDRDNRFLVANRSFAAYFELDRLDYVNRTSAELGRLSAFYGQFSDIWSSTDEQAWAERTSRTFEIRIPEGKDGERVFDITKLPQFHPDGSRRGLVVIARDVTERKIAAARIHHLAHHDNLTGLPNRMLFQERLRDAIAQARRAGTSIALLLLDLDKFKEVNDTLGHHVGDLLLRAVAKRLGRCVRETDTVARLGGDEFAVLLTNLADADGASTVAETIIRSIAEPFGLEDSEIVCGVSVGITLFPADGLDSQSLLKNADLALYRSKNDGRGRYHFFIAEMNHEVQSRKSIERDLRHALIADQLNVYYQPLIDIQSGRILGAEALTRWFHPSRGPIPPSRFIPVAERSDLIFRLGRWVLQRACEQVREWNEAGLPHLQMSVNLSSAQFRHPDLLDTIRTIVEQTGIDPAQLQLEITETIAMTNFDYSVQILQELRRLGLTIAIDDFGTGYSSLSYLRHFPVDKLKIDRSFVVDLDLHPGNDAIVRAIVSLGHGIGAKVNVEGIETREQLAFMRDLSCDECQGYYFSHALAADAYADLIGRAQLLNLQFPHRPLSRTGVVA